jgi:hypothetical protein
MDRRALDDIARRHGILLLLQFGSTSPAAHVQTVISISRYCSSMRPAA